LRCCLAAGFFAVVSFGFLPISISFWPLAALQASWPTASESSRPRLIVVQR
jgi:hypothetical protein